MLRKVKLYGQLAEFIGHKEFEVKVNNVSQAVSFLIHNFPHVESHMSPKYYQVKVGNYDIEEHEITYPVGQEDIHFIPVISGAGGGTGKFLLGAALIGASFFFPGAGLFGTTSFGGASAGVVGISTKGALFATKIGTASKSNDVIANIKATWLSVSIPKIPKITFIGMQKLIIIILLK